MRTSRISRDTDRILRGLRPRNLANGKLPPSASRRHSFRHAPDSTPSGIASDGVDSESELSSPPPEPRDHDDTTSTYFSSPRKRKRGAEGLSHTLSNSVAVSSTSVVKTETTNGKVKRAKRQPAKRLTAPDGDVKVEPPPNWEEMYALTAQMRSQTLAPVDTMGCESLAEETRSPRVQRFQTLIALMLSSQTKDTVTAVAIKNLQQNLPGGLNVESILAVSPSELNSLIEKVGFHNNKTRYIKATAEILQSQYDSDIPSTIDGLISLPGVGPKMAYLCMSSAWGRDEGIGVDVHVHRITNLWGWHKTRTPEETRAALEAWLPKEKWHDINHLLVGFGQTICLPVGRRCGECTLADRGLCPSAVVATKVRQRSRIVATALKTGHGIKIKEEELVKVEKYEIKAEQLESPTAKVGDIEDIGLRHD